MAYNLVDDVPEESKESKEKKARDHKNATRKIIDNNFQSGEVSTKEIAFRIDPGFESSITEEEKIHHQMLFDELHILIEDSEFKIFNHPDEKGVIKKLNKLDINKVFNFAVNTLPQYSKIDLFSVVSEYFDIDYVKFFTSLSNLYREKLIDELEAKSNILNKKKIKRLF